MKEACGVETGVGFEQEDEGKGGGRGGREAGEREQGEDGWKAYESSAEAIWLWSKGDQEMTVQVCGGAA